MGGFLTLIQLFVSNLNTLLFKLKKKIFLHTFNAESSNLVFFPTNFEL